MSITSIALFLWLAEFVGLVQTILGLGCIISGALGVAYGLNMFIQRSSSPKFLIKSIPLWFCVTILVCAIPSKNTIYLIGGAYAGNKVIDGVKNSIEYNKLMELFNLSIDKALIELKKEVK